MQDYYLTVDKFLDHAAKWFSTVDTVEAGEGRLSYAVMRERSNRLSGALLALGAMPGDRIATLDWNTIQHLEAYYAVMGAGMVCHTLNPRMTATQLATVIEEAGGSFTDWQGNATVQSREAIATNGLVRDEVLAITRGN